MAGDEPSEILHAESAAAVRRHGEFAASMGARRAVRTRGWRVRTTLVQRGETEREETARLAPPARALYLLLSRQPGRGSAVGPSLPANARSLTARALCSRDAPRPFVLQQEERLASTATEIEEKLFRALSGSCSLATRCFPIRCRGKCVE